MPTAARLVAAICLAALGYLASEVIKPLMPEGTGFGLFSEINAGLGLLAGWVVVGSRVGRGMANGISAGITGVAVLVFWGLFLQAAYEMFHQSMRHRFDGPVEAFAAIFQIAVDMGGVLLAPAVLVTLVAGAVVTGVLAETASRHWR